MLTKLKEFLFLPQCMRMFVRLSTCNRDNSKRCELIFMKLAVNYHHQIEYFPLKSDFEDIHWSAYLCQNHGQNRVMSVIQASRMII